MKIIRRERTRSSDTFDSHDGLNLVQSFSDHEDEKRWVASEVRSSGGEKRHSQKYYEQNLKFDEKPLEASVMKYKEEMRKRRMTKSNKSQFCRYTVDKVQGILLPQRLSSYIPVSKDDDDDLGEYKESFKHPSRIPLIKGLERVTSGSQPASEVVATCGMKPHKFIWFIISGCLCDIVQFFIDLTLYYVFKVKDTTVCWTLGFALSIVVRHTSHRYLVFGNYVGGYWYSLLRMYAGYSISLTLSTLFNWVLTHKMQFQHYSGWMITLVGTNIINYCLLTHLWKWDCSKQMKQICSKRRSINDISDDHQERQVV